MAARLGVLSDTHLPKPAGIPAVVLRAFEGVDAIIHGGDVTDLTCLEPLMRVAPVYVVTGNNDPMDMADRFGWRRALRWRGWRVGLVHGDVGHGRTTPQKARSAFLEAPPKFEEIPLRQQTKPLPPLPDTRVPVPSGRPDRVRLEDHLAAPFDCIIFGHSHQPHCALVDGVLLLNPGSPTERRHEPRASFAVIEADDDATSIEVRFLYL